MVRAKRLAAIGLVSATVFMTGLSVAFAGTSGKVTICHVPPGNPAAAHTITVGAPAVSAHLAHGDSLGACESPYSPLFGS